MRFIELRHGQSLVAVVEQLHRKSASLPCTDRGRTHRLGHPQRGAHIDGVAGITAGHQPLRTGEIRRLQSVGLAQFVLPSRVACFHRHGDRAGLAHSHTDAADGHACCCTCSWHNGGTAAAIGVCGRTYGLNHRTAQTATVRRENISKTNVGQRHAIAGVSHRQLQVHGTAIQDGVAPLKAFIPRGASHRLHHKGLGRIALVAPLVRGDFPRQVIHQAFLLHPCFRLGDHWDVDVTADGSRLCPGLLRNCEVADVNGFRIAEVHRAGTAAVP